MNRHNNRFFRPLPAAFRVLSVAGCLFALLAGCGDGSNRKMVQGTVTLDGNPLEKGYVRLAPVEGTESPTAGAPIEQGEFSIAAAGGVFAGKFRVEITASRRSAKKVHMHTHLGDFFDYVGEQYLPARYNTQSELVVEVKPDGPNQFTYELTSRSK